MLSKKIKNLNPSVTISISNKILELKSQGINITNLSIGEPDFKTPDNAKLGAIEGILKDCTKYDHASGYLELREAIATKLKKENNIDYSPDEIVVSNGAKHAITNTLLTILDPGDEVLIPKPYWVSYPESVKLLGGQPIFVTTQQNNEFKVTVKDLETLVTNQTKALIINNPINPTGGVYTQKELEPLVKFCIENEIYIIADEIYERIIFDKEFVSLGTFKEAKDWIIIINGLSKSASMTGWRLGYSATNKTLASAISSIQGHLVSHPSTISQKAGIKALTDCDEAIEQMVQTYQKRRDTAVELLDTINAIDYLKPDGAFYIFLDFSALKDVIDYEESFSLKVCELLLEDYQLALVPGIAFGEDNFIRLCYAADLDSIKEGIQKIKQFIQQYIR